MPYHSRWNVPIPQCSLPTFLFKSPTYDLSDKPQYIDALDTSSYITRDAFRTWSSRFALGLLRSNVFKPGDRVLIFSGNAMMYPVAFMGVVMAGGIFTGANPGYTARELAYQWKDSGAAILLCAETSLDTGLAAAKEAGMSQDQIFIFDSLLLGGNNNGGQGSRGLKNWKELFVSESEAKGWQWEDLKKDGETDRTLALNYSSGTTGFPKGVEISHRNYVSNTIQHNHLSSLKPGFTELEKTNKWLLFLPLYHALAQTVYIAGSFMREIPVYVMPKFDFEMMLQCIEKFGIQEITCVPPIAVAIAKSPLVKKYDLSSIRSFGVGAAPLGRDIAAQVEKVWDGKFNVKQGYGMTEVTCSILGYDPNLFSSSFSVGEPNANTSAKVMQIDTKDDGTETYSEITKRGPEHRGELWVAGPNIMKGYWRNAKATNETFAPTSASNDGERWLRTGDIAYVDADGMFFIVDRSKELIKVKGNQVAPAELEALLLEHEAVQDAAVIGVPTADGDEAPRAYLILQPSSKGKVSGEDIVQWVATKVVKFKRIAGGVEVVEAIPKNPSGKILRKVLREEYKNKMAAETSRPKL